MKRYLDKLRELSTYEHFPVICAGIAGEIVGISGILIGVSQRNYLAAASGIVACHLGAIGIFGGFYAMGEELEQREFERDSQSLLEEQVNSSSEVI